MPTLLYPILLLMDTPTVMLIRIPTTPLIAFLPPPSPSCLLTASSLVSSPPLLPLLLQNNVIVFDYKGLMRHIPGIRMMMLKLSEECFPEMAVSSFQLTRILTHFFFLLSIDQMFFPSNVQGHVVRLL
jgi:hypothetical protein